MSFKHSQSYHTGGLQAGESAARRRSHDESTAKRSAILMNSKRVQLFGLNRIGGASGKERNQEASVGSGRLM